jgi:hypothetical protein
MKTTGKLCAYALVLAVLGAGRVNAIEQETYVRVIRILAHGEACFGVYEARSGSLLRTFGPGCAD